MAGELRRWFAIMLYGSRTPPRLRPRAQMTARLHLTWALPVLRGWAAAGMRRPMRPARAQNWAT